MPKPTPWQDESTLLCEGCGYVVQGLSREANCPECGRPIAQSLPERRPGTPFQNHPGTRALLTTGLRTLLQPMRTLDEIRFDLAPEADNALALWHAMATGLILMPVPLLATLSLLHDLPSTATGAVILFIVTGVGFLFFFAYLLAIIVRALTVTETLGLRVISRQRGFRITPRTATLITSHGSVGWTAGALLAWLGGGAAYLTMYDPKFGPHWPGVSLAAGLGLLAGFLFFETFAWLGLRRLKFANGVRTSPPGTGEGRTEEGPVADAPGS